LVRGWGLLLDNPYLQRTRKGCWQGSLREIRYIMISRKRIEASLGRLVHMCSLARHYFLWGSPVLHQGKAHILWAPRWLHTNRMPKHQRIQLFVSRKGTHLPKAVMPNIRSHDMMCLGIVVIEYQELETNLLFRTRSILVVRLDSHTRMQIYEIWYILQNLQGR